MTLGLQPATITFQAHDSLLVQADLGKLGYAFQFVTLAGFHTLNHSMFQLAKGYAERGMAAYSTLQQAEMAAESEGYTATKHQREACSCLLLLGGSSIGFKPDSLVCAAFELAVYQNYYGGMSRRPDLANFMPMSS